MKKLVLFFAASMLLFLSSCVKQDFDTPPISEIPVGTVYTIAQLRQMYADSGAYQFNTDASVYAVVTMDETSGNIYKSAFIQDANDAVNIHLLQSGGLRIGDSIRIYLKGVVLSDYGGMFQLDNVNNDSSIVILATQKDIAPKDATIEDLLAGKYKEQLVKLNNVQFAETDTGKVFAEPDKATNRKLEDCQGNQVDVRTSNYATFAPLKVPDKRGSLIAIAGSFNGLPQLLLRSASEIVMDSARCEIGGGGTPVTPVDSVNEQFDNAENYTDIAITGWTNIKVAGDRAWQGKIYNTDKYAQASGYNSGLSDMETWLITPPVKNDNGDMVLSFKSAMAYWKHTGDDKPLTILASTDFDGTNFATAHWTELSATLPTANNSNYEWVNSGDISLANFKGNVAIAFKYKGSDSESTSIELDDVVIHAGTGGGTNPGTVTSFDIDFSDQTAYQDIAINGWITTATKGTRNWQGKEYSTNYYAHATAYKSTDDENEEWLISPPIDLDAMTNPTLSFDTEKAYWSHTDDEPFEVLISTDFDGTNIESATWQKLSATIATKDDSDYTWVHSGDVDLSSYSGTAYIAFRYYGNAPKGETTTYDIDNLKLFDK
ncbi:DUF5689 domain-containing protein [Candidatus Sulfidibacterium hydrothermale]|uniref:DUF5689 domain-containing protein n=1 Tax=Candidatus Sulfidibacterium hydrothermale TaxID=2875962 RepID=UPI001F0A931B|nr:DUF5689 domain-containing protein [Candidatus Sulfidibacterium hydrothermale]UBM61851.1 DUF5689 domain-containing protein [Candidatus Sulfidibacterium hydrothermale]